MPSVPTALLSSLTYAVFPGYLQSCLTSWPGETRVVSPALPHSIALGLIQVILWPPEKHDSRRGRENRVVSTPDTARQTSFQICSGAGLPAAVRRHNRPQMVVDAPSSSYHQSFKTNGKMPGQEARGLYRKMSEYVVSYLHRGSDGTTWSSLTPVDP
jgi:hypothetical protein